ncbi:hypothetical protein GW891_05205, partial [bacterium]|nr:hypothetical protein [bacterium]
QAIDSNSFLFSGVIISSFDIDNHEIVEYLYQKFLILSTNCAVISAHNSSNDLARIFLIAHFLRVSLIKPNPSGTISLNSNLP